jgi:UPF0755 protein
VTKSAVVRPYLLTALVVSLGFSVFTALRPSNEFPSNKPGNEVVIAIGNGEFGSSIAQTLKEKGVIKEAAPFISLANDPHSGAVGIAPGSHRIHSHITSRQALDELLDRSRLTDLVNVEEGSTVSDVLKILAQDPHIVGKTQDALRHVQPAISNAAQSLEGQLAPASYTFAQGTSAAQALQSMVTKFKTSLTQIGFSNSVKGYSPYDVLKIASLVQIEADAQDYSRVAGVIYNRLRIGMPLQLNSTVQYANGSRGKIALSVQATKINSSYNTYKFIGLPPTPISNPSSGALLAAMNPEAHNFLYFITIKPHDTRFTKDYAIFQKWVTEYNHNLAAGLFK